MVEGRTLRIVLAPSWRAAALRSILVFGAMLLIGWLMLGAKGAPQHGRDVHWNEFELFAVHPFGVVQLAGELLLVVILAWAFREQLKIRL